MSFPENSSNLAGGVIIDITASPQFAGWLEAENITLAFTTYQSGRLGFLQVNDLHQITGFGRLYSRAMGLYTSPERLYLSTEYQLWRFENVLAPGRFHQGHDKLFVPRIGYTTGYLDIHDIAVDKTDRIIFVSSLLNCLATVSQRHSCTPLWTPPFISKIINEDRCHLNGLAMIEGEPRYVTAIGRSDVAEGWREQRHMGGCVIEVPTNEVILVGLSMPHSPRWYQNRLWLLNSGTGEFGYVDQHTGQFEAIAFCHGYARGLAFWRDWAIVGLSKPRTEDGTFRGLALDERLLANNIAPRCGFLVIDLKSGAIAHWLRLEGVVTELYDVQVLPGVRNPMTLGFQTDEIRRLLTLDSIAKS